MNPSISTSPVAASCTTAGASPCIFSKSISTAIPCALSAKNKKPAEFGQRVGGKSAKNDSLYDDLRRHARHVRMMVMMAMDQRNHATDRLQKRSLHCQLDTSAASVDRRTYRPYTRSTMIGSQYFRAMCVCVCCCCACVRSGAGGRLI